MSKKRKNFRGFILNSLSLSLSLSLALTFSLASGLYLQGSAAAQETDHPVDTMMEDILLYKEQLNFPEKGWEIPLSAEAIMEKIFNFGVVIQNQNFTIYRSSLLGYAGLATLDRTLQSKNLPFPKTIIYMNKQGYNPYLPPIIGNFAVEEFKAQEEYGHKFYHPFDYSNRTYVDGHDPYNPVDDIDSEWFILSNEAKGLFGVVEDNQKDGGMENFLRVLNLILDPKNQPVLFHCFGGRHRTGMMGMALRYLQGGEWVDGPKEEVYIPAIRKSVPLNKAQREYFHHNSAMVRMENFEFIEKFSQDPRFLELKQRFNKMLQPVEDI